VERLLLIDRLRSLATKATHQRKRRLKRKQHALWYKIRNWIDDVQWKTARWMCAHHQTVLLGKLPVKALASKAKRNLGKKGVRMLYAWGHYRFQQRLLSKAEELCCEARVVNESWTSKTCSAQKAGNGTTGWARRRRSRVRIAAL
jgi:IS605 OrfB family transposase